VRRGGVVRDRDPDRIGTGAQSARLRDHPRRHQRPQSRLLLPRG
jgi:hypothetical protein